MAAGTVQKPGTQYGPCKAKCNHVDCRMMRHIAESLCAICNKQIGYETRFYEHRADPGNGRVDHALCVELAAEKEQERS